MINGVQCVMMSGESMMPVLHVDNLVSHMELVKPLIGLVVELDQFGWTTLNVLQQLITFLTVQETLSEATIVYIQKMLVQDAFQSVSVKGFPIYMHIMATCL